MNFQDTSMLDHGTDNSRPEWASPLECPVFSPHFTQLNLGMLPDSIPTFATAHPLFAFPQDHGCCMDRQVDWSVPLNPAHQRLKPRSRSRSCSPGGRAMKRHRSITSVPVNLDEAEGVKCTAATESPKVANSEVERHSLACPYHKRNPLKYRDCQRFEFKRIKDVKQHVQRRHAQPEFFCPRCFSIFDTEESRDGHMRAEARCQVQRGGGERFDGISKSQKKELVQNVSRGKSVEEQWYSMWDIIFPGAARPASVFPSEGLEWLMPALRRVWKDRRDEIIPQVYGSLSQTIRVADANQQLLPADQVMDSFFRCFEEDMLSTGPGPDMSRVTSSMQSASIDSSFVSESTAASGFNNWEYIDVQENCAWPTSYPLEANGFSGQRELEPDLFGYQMEVGQERQAEIVESIKDATSSSVCSSHLCLSPELRPLGSLPLNLKRENC